MARNPERLENLYEEVKQIHKRSFPDWRFIQLMYNFLGWIQSEKKVDGWYYEEDKALELLKEYAELHGMKG